MNKERERQKGLAMIFFWGLGLRIDNFSCLYFFFFECVGGGDFTSSSSSSSSHY